VTDRGALEVTVIGSSCSIPRPGRACSAYLIDGGGSRTIVDFGTGALASLRSHFEPEEIDAIVISHMHADHFLDLIPLRYALKYGNRTNERKIAVYLPPQGERILRQLASAFVREGSADFLDEVFTLHSFDEASQIELGETIVRFAATQHYIPTCAVRVELGDASVTYSADAAATSELVDFARGTGFFLCEATLFRDEHPGPAPGHMSAADAGELAASADVAHLGITHYPADANPDELYEDAARVYKGEITIVDDHAQFAVG